MRFYLIGLLMLQFLLNACSTAQTEPIPDWSSEEEQRAFLATIDQYSDGEKSYNGPYNQFEFRSTLLNTTIRKAQLSRQARYYRWEEPRLASEVDKSLQEANVETSVFVSFFTPFKKNDNLPDGNSIWRVFIEAGGKRYDGKVKRDKRLFAELETLFPYHERWGSAYLMKFPVSTSLLESTDATMTITGPLGAKTVKFHAIKQSN